MNYTLIAADQHSKARAGLLSTDHGLIETPVFMPVGTAGSVKAVHQHELRDDIKARIILGNTYHLYLRPGLEILQQAGGLHRFNGWEKPVLTDSGGYQVFSLSNRRKITEEGATFSSHIDGSKHLFSPESAMDIQRRIGADIVMAFDECTPYPCDRDYAKKSMERTHRWLDRCIERFETTDELYGYSQVMFPIVQGSVYDDLRETSARYIVNTNQPGYAIGGLSVGEPAADMYRITASVCEILPEDKPRYLMGVGTPENILECIARGIDMFDCVMPTRNARNGMLFTSEGIINIRNRKWADDFTALDPLLTTFADRDYTKAYLRHLMISGEYLAGMIASVHNLGFYMWLVDEARRQILAGSFATWKEQMIPKITRRL
jgi:queuine tRNA-ribosyltransferase